MRIRIQIQGFDDKKIGKNLQLKKITFCWSKIAIYLSIGLHKRTSNLQEKSSSLKREHLALQNLNFLHFYGSFWPSWIRIRIPNADPDPADQNECVSAADPDPQHW